MNISMPTQRAKKDLLEVGYVSFTSNQKFGLSFNKNDAFICH